MTGRTMAMMAAGWAAVGSAMAASFVVWMLLMRPFDLVGATSPDDVAGLARLAVSTLYDMLLRLLDLL